MSPPRYEHHIELLAVEHARFLLDIPLNDWHDPLGIYFVIVQILAYVVIPEVPRVASLPHALVTAERLTSHETRTLTARGQVEIVCEVEVTRGEELLNTLNIVLELGVARIRRVEIVIEWEELHGAHYINVGAFDIRYTLLLGYASQEVMPSNIYDAQETHYDLVVASCFI